MPPRHRFLILPLRLGDASPCLPRLGLFQSPPWLRLAGGFLSAVRSVSSVRGAIAVAPVPWPPVTAFNCVHGPHLLRQLSPPIAPPLALARPAHLHLVSATLRPPTSHRTSDSASPLHFQGDGRLPLWLAARLRPGLSWFSVVGPEILVASRSSPLLGHPVAVFSSWTAGTPSQTRRLPQGAFISIGRDRDLWRGTSGEKTRPNSACHPGLAIRMAWRVREPTPTALDPFTDHPRSWVTLICDCASTRNRSACVFDQLRRLWNRLVVRPNLCRR